MPFAERGPIPLYYESHGRGPAVLLVMGFGMALTAWWRTVPVLAQSFRVLAFDNRGIGRSAPAQLPYSVGHLADDAVAVLDAAGEDAAHVYGISLGGMIAQEVALRHPERVRALVLGATTPGGTRATPPGETVRSFFARAVAMEPEETAWASVPFIYAERTRRRHGDRIAADIARRVPYPTDPRAYAQQLTAAATHSAGGRLARVASPTLVVHGEHDLVVPPENARLVADAIPGAELRILERAGHFYITDHPRADRDVARFLRRHSPRARAHARGHTPTQAGRAAPGRRRRRARRSADAVVVASERVAALLMGSRFPILRYDRLTADRVLRRVEHLGPNELRRVAERERGGRNRTTILRAIERRLG